MWNPHRKWLAWMTWGVVIAIGGCSGRAVVPTSYSTFSDQQYIFKIQYPDGWSNDSGGQKSYSWVKFNSGNALIEVEADLVSRALLSDIATSGVVPLSISPGLTNTLESARKAHWLEQKKFVAERGVKEEKPVNMQTNLGEGLKSEYTGSSTFSGEFRGYRATAMNNDKRIRVVCQCPVGEWEALKSVFDKVIASLDRNPINP